MATPRLDFSVKVPVSMTNEHDGDRKETGPDDHEKRADTRNSLPPRPTTGARYTPPLRGAS